MSITKPYDKPTSFNVERVRERLLDGLTTIPSQLFDEALQTTRRNLNAKRRHFFAKDGHVIEHQDTDNPIAQLNAADQVYKILGLYAPVKEEANDPNSVVIETNPETGVVTISIGGSRAPSGDNNLSTDQDNKQRRQSLESHDQASLPFNELSSLLPHGEETLINRQGSLSPSETIKNKSWNILMDEEV